MSACLPSDISSVSLVDLPHHSEINGDLVVFEGLAKIPFSIKRVFIVRALKNSIRGRHAHKACAQFLICSNGSVKVICTDGFNKAQFELNHPNLGLYIPPGIWSEQQYTSEQTSLTVLCDRFFEIEDYIRDYAEFLRHQENLIKQENSSMKGAP